MHPSPTGEFDRGVPSLPEANRLLRDAEALNPGPWVQHSLLVGQAARLIAQKLVEQDHPPYPGLSPETAYIFGCLHDIGRRAGATDLRHTLDGYLYLRGLGFPAAAQVCLTHSFPVQDIRAGSGRWDCAPPELEIVQAALSGITYTIYDRLIQLCDALALPSGFCLIEKRLVDVALRHGVNDFSVRKWRAFLDIQKELEQALQSSIYSLLPGVEAHTFGTSLQSDSGR
jgi:hypothetical protein